MSTKDLINAIVIGDAIAIENAFEATMAEKISARLDDMRVEVAQSMFKVQEEVELDEAADMAKLRQQLDKHSEAAIKANREGNDEAVKKHQMQMNKIKDKMAKLARNEEVELDEEQLDELSKGTLGSYIKKAGQHRVRLAGKERDLEDKVDQISKAKHGSDDDTYKALSQAQKNVDDQRWKVRDKSDKRAEGIGRAVKRLTKEEAEEILASEEFEQLDELSKVTLASYIKKASPRAAGNASVSTAQYMSGDKDSAAKSGEKYAKRIAGIGKAADKLAKEEVELDEDIHHQIKKLLDAGEKVRSSAAGRAGMDVTGVDGNSVSLKRGNKHYSTTFRTGDKVKIEKRGDVHHIVNEEVELDEAADMAKLRDQLNKHSDAAIEANRRGDDEAVKKHQVQMNKIKDKMAKLARNS